MKKDFVKDWKKASGIRKWENFFKHEYNPKMDKLSASFNACLRSLSYDGGTLCHSARDGLCSLLTAGHVDSQGNRTATYKKLYFHADLEALTSNPEAEINRIINEEFCDQLSRLAFKWDKLKLFYGQSDERCKALGIS